MGVPDSVCLDAITEEKKLLISIDASLVDMNKYLSALSVVFLGFDPVTGKTGFPIPPSSGGS